MALGGQPMRLVRIRTVTIGSMCREPARNKWLEEARRAGRARHPGLLAGIECGAEEDPCRLFAVTEWADGAPLGARLRREGRMAMKDALRIADEAAAALGEAWRAERVYHGHLTPDTIHLWPEGRVSVLDLGASGVEALCATESPGELVRLLRAAPNWCAPELARASGAADVRADIYSLGAVIYHMVTGQIPFGDRPAAEALDKHLMGFLEDPCEVVPELPPPVGWLIERMMARDPAARFREWEEVRQAIAAAARGSEPAGARLSAGASVVRRGGRRDPALAASLQRPATFARRHRRPMRAGAKPNGEPRPSAATAPNSTPAARPVTTGSSGMGRVFAIAAVVALAAGLWLRDPIRRALVEASKPPPAVLEVQPAATGNNRDKAPSVVPGPRVTLEEILEMRPANLTPPPTPAEAPSQDNGAAAPPPPQNGPPNNGPAPHPLANVPAFKQAAELFNAALQLYRQYQQTQQVELLDRVEAMSEEAARLFEQCRAAHPGDASLNKYIEQCYGMVRYARQSRLSSGRLTSGRPRPPRPPRSEFRPPLPAPPSSIQTPGAPPLPSAEGDPAPAPPRRSMQIPPTWNAPIRIGAGLARELRDVFRNAGVDPWDGRAGAAVAGVLPADIPLFEPLDQAARRLRLPPIGGTGTDVTFPGFPDRTLRFFAFDSASALPPYRAGRLLVDGLGQTVGIQWLDEQPGPQMLPDELFSPRWSVVDPIAGRIREKSAHRIAHRVSRADGAVVVDTEVIDPSSPPAVRSLGRYRLGIAEPVVGLILSRTSAVE